MREVARRQKHSSWKHNRPDSHQSACHIPISGPGGTFFFVSCCLFFLFEVLLILCFVWLITLLAQHLDHQGKFEPALEYMEKAIAHTPTFVDLYAMKAKILKHSGDQTKTTCNNSLCCHSSALAECTRLSVCRCRDRRPMGGSQCIRLRPQA